VIGEVASLHSQLDWVQPQTVAELQSCRVAEWQS